MVAMWKKGKPPLDVVDDILASRQEERALLKELTRVTAVPVFTRSGDLVNEPGYHPASGLFYSPLPGLRFEVPDEPTDDDIDEAVTLLGRVLNDFPFVHASDRAHAIALMFEHFVREMWDGPSPLYLFNKPTAGTGASLLVSCISAIVLGEFAPMRAQPDDDEEWRKNITTLMLEGSQFVVYDDVESLGSPALREVLTADVYSDRVLGYSRSITVPVRCSWAATGNNVSLDQQMWRRCVNVRLDAQVEQPEARPPSTFAIPNLKAWVLEHRVRLVEAILTIVRGWCRLGMPKADISKASYEGWAQVLGGVLDYMDVNGFLQTPEDRQPVESDPQVEEIRQLVSRWLRYVVRPELRPAGLAPTVFNGRILDPGIEFRELVQAKDLAKLIEVCRLPFELGPGDKARALGGRLREVRDRTYDLQFDGGSLTVAIRGKSRNASLHWILEFDEELAKSVISGGPADINAQAQEAAERQRQRDREADEMIGDHF